MNKPLLLAAAAAVSLGFAAEAVARDQIRIVGSSTVYPFAIAVAEDFGRSTQFSTPVIESTGSGGGLKLFCEGVGVNTPDVTNASRKIKTSEIELCASNGVTGIVEVRIGFDGIVLANSKAHTPYSLTKEQVFLALAKEVPTDGELAANPYTTWSEIDSSLPNEKIEIYGPPPTSGTRDAFVELVMEEACESFQVFEEMTKDDQKRFCAEIREDGVFIEAGENDNLIVQKLEANPRALGIFGYSFLDQNADKVQGSLIDGVVPTFENIADGAYPVSRSLYFYVKQAHVGVIPGLVEYVEIFTSDAAAGPDGFLSERGLIPLPNDERQQMRADATAMKTINELQNHE
ncbi:MAG: PstS family phosphate ABC transporter substrate-binding protein [Rhodospirillales bacterium]